MKDQRYKAIKSLIESKNIQRFKDIFTIVPISTVREDMKINYNTLRRRIDNVDLLTVRDIKLMAKLFDVEDVLLFQLIQSEYSNQPVQRRKGK
ncbi:MAG: hypothetical protein IM598_10695 [Chitinophagaceae bacterium]|nr:hypothetical protein [Chitinophagaceae bacterium]MCA6460398.1 hypothetical protein [Chitinophagaceae bacterium]MCA6465285.1 hypothetical protein [Chitinophagaceae bacterium]